MTAPSPGLVTTHPATEARVTCRPAVVVNPTKVSNARTLHAVLTKALSRAQIVAEPIWLETTPQDPGFGQTQAALAHGADLVMAYGGDGTVRSCAAALAATGVPLAMLPGGTGNLLARNLDIPLTLRAAVDVAIGGSVRPIDVCHASDEDFITMAGIGFDARMMANTSAALKREFGWLAYGLAAMRTMSAAPTMRIRLELDDDRSRTTSGVGVLAANVGTLTGGITLLPHAVADDGLLAVAVLTPRRLRDWAGLGGRLTSHRAPKPTQLRCWQTRSVQVSLDRPALVEIDGEVLDERDELDCSVTPGALAVKVPLA
jgi:YegS/Rv2252/BmrU family lipid kinase